MSLSKVVKFYEFGAGRHDFYRCFKCHKLFTQEYERERMHTLRQNEDSVMHVHCTSLRYQPATPFFLEWLYPSVLAYTFKVVMARAVAPWAEKRGHVKLRELALRLASNKVTRDE